MGNVIMHFTMMLLLCGNLLATDEYTKVVILGNSFQENAGSGIQEDVLTKLLLLAKGKRPKAVFFLGDLAFGLTITQGNESLTPKESGEEESLNRKRSVYNSDVYERRLSLFHSIVEQTLGKDIPFYPVLGMQESFGPDSAALVKQQFGLHSQIESQISPLAYTVNLGNAFFVVFSSVSYNPIEKKVSQHLLGQELLDWVSWQLEAGRKRADYLFAVSYEPAFSLTAAEGRYAGLDKNPVDRDLLWRIFSENGVSAYFSSSEHLYDRTNRDGIWQIISGGAGAHYHQREFDRAFYHLVVLWIPKEKGRTAKIQVYDLQGVLSDTFEVSHKQYPLYQLRISALYSSVLEYKALNRGTSS